MYLVLKGEEFHRLVKFGKFEENFCIIFLQDNSQVIYIIQETFPLINVRYIFMKYSNKAVYFLSTLKSILNYLFNAYSKTVCNILVSAHQWLASAIFINFNDLCTSNTTSHL